MADFMHSPSRCWLTLGRSLTGSVSYTWPLRAGCRFGFGSNPGYLLPWHLEISHFSAKLNPSLTSMSTCFLTCQSHECLLSASSLHMSNQPSCLRRFDNTGRAHLALLSEHNTNIQAVAEIKAAAPNQCWKHINNTSLLPNISLVLHFIF